MSHDEATTDNDISETPSINSNINLNLYDRKHQSKTIRVLTVLAYILSVSLAAIFLSIYYIFIWDGQPTLALKSYPGSTVAERIYLQSHNMHSILKKNPMQQNNKVSFSTEDLKSSTESHKNEDNLFIHVNSIEEVLNDIEMESILENSTKLNVDRDKPASGIEQTTTEYEDTTALAFQQNFTQQSDEYDNINSNLEQLERSVLIKKLIRHHNMIPR